MSTEISTTEETKREVDAALANLLAGKRDPQLAREACERMDLAREQIRQRVGTVEVAVDLIRELRDR